MKKRVPFEWDEACANAFKSIKEYLMKAPVLVAPVSGHPLILYIAAQERSVGALLAQENEKGKENALYYLSRMMTPNELNYSPVEKLCLALIFSIQKLKHYFQAHTVRLISKANPLKYVMTRPVLSDRLARWYLQIRDHLSEYQALILGLEMAVDVKRLNMKVYGDYKLVVNQIMGLYEVKKPELLPHVKYAQRLIGWLGGVELEHVPRKDNKQADTLAKLASTIAMPDSKVHIPICKSWVLPPILKDEDDEEEDSYAVEVFEISKEDWRQPFVDYLKYDKLPSEPHRRVDIQHRANRFIYFKGTLYRRSFDGVFLRCLGDEKVTQVIEEAHSAFNKTLCNLLKKVVSKSKRDWHERIGEALWAYRTTHRTPTQATPYSLVYSVEVVVPLEQQLLSLRIAIQEGLTEEENARLRLEELEALDEKRLEAQQRLECYRARLSRAFNKKVRPRFFQIGDLVLAIRRPIITTHRVGSKFIPRWDGPYVVKEVYTNGAYHLISEDRLDNRNWRTKNA
ncbi:hypothetical protein C2S53_011214 [Perilla frutescens var. hirtella]|uniref:Reverse transcriptase/retrotransposon-derived protein RNase H-like domain-containing protein n=1 Tax=Perilla frutescens var. hirtella TaxID=608512 RepID=A0AAD4JM51_PERFH|nr:hypothetical protein C2S53_011214 [Perilla frutescens var. hirtella]